MLKRTLFTLIICFLAVFQTSCEEIATLLESSAGCMLEDSGNYSASALLACTTGVGCEGENAGVANCCCEEVIYGCAVSDAFNYNATAKKCSPCVSGTTTDTAEDCCCEAVVTGCYDDKANNHNVNVNTPTNAESCIYNSTDITYTDENNVEQTLTDVIFGCMDETTPACNYNSQASADCSQKNAITEGSSWTMDANCCSYATNSTCYYDGNNNGYYESTQTMTTSVCDCGLALGGGWKNVNQVSNDVEVQGCRQPQCPEFKASANVEPPGACCNDIDGFDVDTTSTMYSLLGAYEVEFAMGYVENETCMADTNMWDMDMDDWGPDEDIMILGYGGEFQHYMEFTHELTGWEIWDYEVDPTDQSASETFDGCEAAANSAGQDYFMCLNYFGDQGEDNMGCWEIADGQSCNSRADCHWETRFCHYDFEGAGVPCNMLDATQCANDPACMLGMETIDPNGNTFNPCIENNSFVDPWALCENLTDTGCASEPNCELITYGGQGSANEEGTPWCLNDCVGFDTLKNCDGKSEADCNAAASCEWEAPDTAVTGDMGSCGASINTVCGFIDGVMMGENSDCVWDCPDQVMNQFYTFSAVCSPCFGEDSWWTSATGWDQDGDGDVDLEDCVDSYSGYIGDDTGDDTGNQTYSECVPLNMEACLAHSTSGLCTEDTRCQWVEFMDWDGTQIAECEPQFTGPADGGGGGGTNCFGMIEATCNVTTGCEWNLDPMSPNGGHCDPEMVHCETFDSETTCENTNECFWDFPWEFEGQAGICHQFDICGQYHDEATCYGMNGCSWGDGWGEEPAGCYTSQNNEYCDCALPIENATTCTAAGGTWGQPEWADAWEDIQVCTVAFDQGMCYEMEEFQDNDPCAEDLEAMGYNQYIDWYAEDSTCEITFTESEAGSWNLSDTGNELCLMFEDKEEDAINCAQQMTEEECYCGDCEWRDAGFGQTAECVSMQQGNPRMKKQFRLSYNKAVNQLASDPDDELECLPFEVDPSGNIKMTMIDQGGGCQIVKLKKVDESGT